MPRYLIILLIIAGCTPTPRPLEVGSDQCTHCLMGVSDARYGGEVLMSTGKVLPFDAVECMASYLLGNEVEAHSLWVVDYAQPGTLIPVQEARFLHSNELHSPMGLNLTAFSGETASRQSAVGQWMNWNEVMAFVEKNGTHGHSSEAQAGHAMQH